MADSRNSRRLWLHRPGLTVNDGWAKIMSMTKAMKVCYLHLGLHKTASSSFQQTCASNQETLNQAKLDYPIFRCDQSHPPRININNHSVPLRSLYIEKPETYHINKRWKIANINRANQDYKSQLERALQTDRSLVLSGEGLSLLPADALTRLIGLIEQYGFELRPLILVRSPLDYAHSIAQQLVRGGQYVSVVGLGSLRAPQLHQRLTIPDGLKEIRMLQQVFQDRLIAVPFRRACRHPFGPVGYLLQEFCQVDAFGSITWKQTQESKSNLWVRLQNQVNQRWPLFDQKKNLNSNHFQIKQQYSDSGKFRLTRKEVMLLDHQIECSNEALAALLGPDFIEASDEVSAEITNDEILRLLADLSSQGQHSAS